MCAIPVLLFLSTTLPPSRPALRAPPSPMPPALAPLEIPAEVPIPVRHLVVRLPSDAPWRTRAREAYELDLDALGPHLLPEDGAWPEGELGEALREGLCVDDACDGVDAEAAWEEVAAMLEDRGLLDDPPGTVGDPWERYAALWLGYVTSGGLFLRDDEREALQDGILDALDHVPDGPLRRPLALGAVMLGVPDPEPLLWELVDAPDPDLALLGMEGLVAEGVPVAALDGLDLEPDSLLALHRLRLQVEAAEAAGQAGPLEALAGHPLATDDDRRDVEELALRRSAAAPDGLEALVAEAADCAGITAGDEVGLRVRGGAWRLRGDGALADCLAGGSWGRPEDVDVVLRVIR